MRCTITGEPYTVFGYGAKQVRDNIHSDLVRAFDEFKRAPRSAAVYAVLPTSWRGRSGGRSKLDLREMGSRYLFIVLYVFLEHHLSRGDYRQRRAPVSERRPPERARH